MLKLLADRLLEGQSETATLLFQIVHFLIASFLIDWTGISQDTCEQVMVRFLGVWNATVNFLSHDRCGQFSNQFFLLLSSRSLLSRPCERRPGKLLLLFLPLPNLLLDTWRILIPSTFGGCDILV